MFSKIWDAIAYLWDFLEMYLEKDVKLQSERILTKADSSLGLSLPPFCNHYKLTMYSIFPSLTSILKALRSLNILSKASLYFNQVDNQWISYIARHKEKKRCTH